MTNPRFGFDSLPYLHRDGVIGVNASEEESVLNAIDWRPGTFWRGNRLPTVAGNGNFLTWTGAPGAPPDGWFAAGVGETISQIADPNITEAAPYLLSIQRNGVNTFVAQSLSNADRSLSGRVFHIKMRCRTSTPNFLTAQIHDGTTFASSTAHTGSGAFEVLTTAVAVGYGAANLTYAAILSNVDGQADIDWIVVVEQVLDQDDIPEWTNVADTSLYVFPADGQILKNWLYHEWPDGGESLPARWELLVGTPSLYFRNWWGQVGSSNLQMNGNNFIVGQEVSGDELDQIRGKTVWHRHWCLAFATGARVGFVLKMSDGSLTGEIAGTPGAGGRAHTGGGTWENLSTSLDVPHDVEAIYPALIQAGAGVFAGYWSGGLFVQQSAEPDPTPHEKTVDYMAFASHTNGTAGRRILLEGSSSNFTTAPTTVFQMDPQDDLAKWDSNQLGANTWPAWRFRITGDPARTPDYQVPETGVLTFGEFFQMPCPPQAPFGILSEQFQSEIPKTRFGAPLGRSIPRIYKSFDMKFQMLTRDFVRDDLFEEWWKHAGGTKGLPFFLQWNDGDYPLETFYVFLPDNQTFDPKLFMGRQVRDFSITLEGMAR